MLNIEEMILQSMKAKQEAEVRTYRAIKSEIQSYKTAKNAKPYDGVAEIQILNRMVKQREDSIKQYSEAGRQDLVQSETDELDILKKLLPAPVTLSEIQSAVIDYCKQHEMQEILGEFEVIKIPAKRMGEVIKAVKAGLPMADGQAISLIVKRYLA